MKISVIMIDGSFRENTYGAQYFSQQDFPDPDYEVIWVEHYDRVPEAVSRTDKVNVVCLNREGEYHSSYCFNEGIRRARGEVLIIPDADQIVDQDFLKDVWTAHTQYDKLVVYGYRYDEGKQNALRDLTMDELRNRCVLTNPANYGGCLSVRKKWLIEINGYEQHEIFSSGFHANGLDVYARFKNLGLAVVWDPQLRLYHPWHPLTRVASQRHSIQKKLIAWRQMNLQYRAFDGLDPARNEKADIADAICRQSLKNSTGINRTIRRSFGRLKQRLVG